MTPAPSVAPGGAGPALAALLGAFRPAGPPGMEVRERRSRLADFVRAAEPRFHRAPQSDRERLRRLLGWDDASLHRFVEAPMVVHSSTHASMNAFAPMVAFPWFALRIMTEAAGRADAGGHTHLRTLLTHNNLSDNRWKPHVWWRLDDRGRLVRHQLFSKQPRFKHRILLRQPVPDLSGTAADGFCEADREAVGLARYTTNFAYFATVYRLALERRTELHVPGGTVEIPVDMMNAFSLGGKAFPRWREALYDQGLVLRRAGGDDELHALDRNAAAGCDAPDPLHVRSTLFCPNYINVGHAFRMGLSVSMGADRMASYEADMSGVLSTFFRAIGEDVPFPQFLGVSGIDLERLLPLPDSLTARLVEEGGKPSLPLYVAVHGDRLRPALDAALSEPTGSLASVVTRRVPVPA
ncbi:hypothetical protein ABT112_04155 [Streptomyces sp. NPDC002055]|uniref:hypothetical protein n=1 Tax=Streptomyces sp. NPDC002055 TaxID=3154534 RepID=UPI00331FA145